MKKNLVKNLNKHPRILWGTYAKYYKDMAELYDRTGNYEMAVKMWENHWKIYWSMKTGEVEKTTYKGERKLLKKLMQVRIIRFVKGSRMFDQWDILNYMFQLSENRDECRMVVDYKLQALYDLTESREIVLECARNWLTLQSAKKFKKALNTLYQEIGKEM